MQNLFIGKETRIFTKRRSKIINKTQKVFLFSKILGKVIFQIAVALFLCLFFIILSIYPSEAKALKTLTIFSKKSILEKHYSGLIVYIKRDYDFKRTMAPRIIGKDGQVVYLNVNRLSERQFSYLLNSGIATFTDNLSAARKRAGNNPLIVNALNTYNSDTAVISNENARSILHENLKSKFLNNFKVSFVME
jgi:hypothetical protein